MGKIGIQKVPNNHSCSLRMQCNFRTFFATYGLKIPKGWTTGREYMQKALFWRRKLEIYSFDTLISVLKILTHASTWMFSKWGLYSMKQTRFWRKMVSSMKHFYAKEKKSIIQKIMEADVYHCEATLTIMRTFPL